MVHFHHRPYIFKYTANKPKKNLEKVSLNIFHFGFEEKKFERHFLYIF